jgi:hypothetical protein
MYIVPIAWLYVAVMMSVAEATNTNGTVLGALFTFLLYGVLPVGLVLYFMGSPSRRRAHKAREAADDMAASEQTTGQALVQPDTSSLPPADTVTPVRKEP